MGDSDDYLARLEEIRESTLAKKTEAERRHRDETEEIMRKRKFRKGREIYRESGSKNQAYYFLGSPKRVLGYQGAVELFGRDYVRQHVDTRKDPNYPEMGKWDEEGDKKVTKEEIGKFRGKIQSIAHRLMEDSYSDSFMTGARLYAKLGKGTKIVPKLLRRAEEYQRIGGILDNRDFLYIKMLIKKREKERESSRGDLEGRVSVFILSSLAGIALGISSLTATGGVVSNLTNTTQGMLGIIFFIVGVAGLVFGRK